MYILYMLHFFSHNARGDFVSRLELLRLGSTRTVLGCVCCQETVIAVRRILSKVIRLTLLKKAYRPTLSLLCEFSHTPQ